MHVRPTLLLVTVEDASRAQRFPDGAEVAAVRPRLEATRGAVAIVVAVGTPPVGCARPLLGRDGQAELEASHRRLAHAVGPFNERPGPRESLVKLHATQTLALRGVA